MNPKDALQILFWEFHEQHPGMEVRDIAVNLDLPEAVLLSSFLGQGAWELYNDPCEILTLLLAQPHPFICHTRMPHAQMETQITKGAVLKTTDENALILEQANAHFHFSTGTWAHTYFLEEETHAGWIRSIQFFNQDGFSTLKIFLDESPATLDETIKTRFCKTDAVFLEHLTLTPLGNTFQFDKDKFTAVTPFTCSGILTRVVESGLSLHAYIRNPGTHHEHVGSLSQVFKRGPWIHALGTGLEIKVQFKQFGTAYIVKNNQRFDLEYYDKTGDFMVGFFVDTPGEQEIWKDFLKNIPR